MSERTLTLAEARKTGVLMEINRRLLHPAGYALRSSGEAGATSWAVNVVEVGPAHGAAVVPATPSDPAVDAAAAFADREYVHGLERVAALGYLRAPVVPDAVEVVTPTGVDVGELAAVAVDSLAATLRRCVVFSDRDAVLDACVRVMGDALRRMSLVSRDGGATWTLARTPTLPMVDERVGHAVMRGEHLCEHTRQLQAASADAARQRADGGDGIGGELLPGEWDDFTECEARFKAARDAALRGDADGRTVLDLFDVVADLERLYGLAQPGMRVHRGEPVAFAEWDAKARPALRDAARESFERMDAYDRIMARELWPWEPADWDALDKRVSEELAAARETMAEAERGYADAAREVENYERAAATIREALERVKAEATT